MVSHHVCACAAAACGPARTTLRVWRVVDAEHVAPRDRVRPLSVGSPIQLDRFGRPPSRRSPPKAFWVAARSTPSEVPKERASSRSTVSPRRASKASSSGVGTAVRSATARQVDPCDVGLPVAGLTVAAQMGRKGQRLANSSNAGRALFSTLRAACGVVLCSPRHPLAPYNPFRCTCQSVRELYPPAMRPPPGTHGSVPPPANHPP